MADSYHCHCCSRTIATAGMVANGTANPLTNVVAINTLTF